MPWEVALRRYHRRQVYFFFVTLLNACYSDTKHRKVFRTPFNEFRHVDADTVAKWLAFVVTLFYAAIIFGVELLIRQLRREKQEQDETRREE